jgi:hypothetical protein
LVLPFDLQPAVRGLGPGLERDVGLARLDRQFELLQPDRAPSERNQPHHAQVEAHARRDALAAP